MNGERERERLIEALLSGEAPTSDTDELNGLMASQLPGLRALGAVFAGFSTLRTAASDGVGIEADRRSAGEAVGAYRLLRPIGAGGAGEVWLAERRDGAVEQQVAIKYLRHARARAIESFERERRLLARLAHPGIARFLDAGRDEHGRPYLVMDYVDGVPVTEHCDRHALDLRARLALFVQVCDAVDHAHRQLVVHRDIKPANVLVDADGRPRLLDFGVARLIDASLPMETTLAPAMTLAYAAPEQLRGDPASTATDVFSLGLLLFRLLAGELPPSRRSASLAQLALGGEIERLSDVAARKAGPAPRALAGDLDAIVAKATRSDIAERYGSAAEFADDIRRFLAARPVRARAPTRAYRLRKFLRRHRTGVAASSFAIAVLLAASAAALWQAQIAREQARRADAQTARASRIADFMTGLIREQNPLARASAKARSVRELVDEGVARTRVQLAGEPDLRAYLLGLFGEAKSGLGDLGGAQALLEEARAGLAAGSSEAARLDAKLATIAVRQGREAEGNALLARALEQLRAGDLDDRVAAARLEVFSASALLGAGKAEAALAAVNDGRRVLRQALGPDHLQVIDADANVAYVLDVLRRDREAEPIVKSVVERLERIAGEDSTWLIDPLLTWARIEKRRDRLTEALALLDRANSLAQAHLEPRHDITVSINIEKAYTLQEAGRLPEALSALAMAERALPPDASDGRFRILSARGMVLVDLRRGDEAEPILREALELQRASAGGANAGLWYSQSAWGRALSAQGRHREAEQAQLEALAGSEALLGRDAYRNTFILRHLAETYQAGGKWSQAVEALKRAIDIASKTYPSTHAVVMQFRVSLAEALSGAGRTAEALAASDAALAERDQHPELGPHLARAALVKAQALHGRGQREAAIALARQGLMDLDRAGIDNPTTREALTALVAVR